MLTVTENCGTRSAGQVIRATLSDTSVTWMKLGYAVPAFPLGPQRSHLWVGAGQSCKIPHDCWILTHDFFLTRIPTV